eukprot:6810140-Alexandrium_andersonii.AAC.1
MIAHLAHGWSKVFAAEKDINLDDAHSFASSYAPDMDLAYFAPPSSRSIGTYLSRVRDSSPGPDGIPYSAWYKA